MHPLDLMANLPETVGEWGSIVIVPNKGLVNICMITKKKPMDFVLFIQQTKQVMEKFYAQHQQPISDQFFWYYKGKFTKVQVSTDNKGNVNVFSPMGLAELMTKEK